MVTSIEFKTIVHLYSIMVIAQSDTSDWAITLLPKFTASVEDLSWCIGRVVGCVRGSR